MPPAAVYLVAAMIVATAAGKPRQCVDCVVKLGGSAATIKARFETLNEDALSQTAEMLAIARKADPGLKVVVVHGAGSFGHHQAKAYAIQSGAEAHPEGALGFAKTRSSVTRLNGLVVKALVDAGVPAVGISPFPSWMTDQGHLAVDAMDPVANALDAGLVPVLHGDAVLDAAQGWAILSGDDIIVRAAEALAPRRAIFLMDVAGVHDRPPDEQGAVLIRRIDVDADGHAYLPRTSVATHDVTGGLRRKLDSAFKLAAAGVPTYLVQVGSESAREAISGELPSIGTTVQCAAIEAGKSATGR